VPVIPTLRRLRHVGREVKAKLDSSVRLHLRKKKEKKNSSTQCWQQPVLLPHGNPYTEILEKPSCSSFINHL
jgi:hypothetical protein